MNSLHELHGYGVEKTIDMNDYLFQTAVNKLNVKICLCCMTALGKHNLHVCAESLLTATSRSFGGLSFSRGVCLFNKKVSNHILPA